MNKINKIMVICIVLLLALASVVAPQWLSSTAFMFIYLIFALLFIVSIFLIPDLFLKILHLLLALLIICFVLVKGFNERKEFVFAEGANYHLLADGDTLDVKLVDFKVEKKDQGKALENYVSEMIINGESEVIAVNKPYAYKRVRLYQRAYGYAHSFTIAGTKDTVQLFPGQSAQIAGKELFLHEYDEFLGKVVIDVDKELRLISLMDKNQVYYVTPAEEREASVLEYVELKGHVPMYIIASLSILLIIFVRFRGL